MSEKHKALRDELKKLVTNAADESTNIASAINVGGNNRHSSVRSKQRVVQRDGVTTKVTEKEERRTDG